MNLGKIMKQAQEMQKKMEDMQAGLKDIDVTGSSGGGMVQVTVNGRGETKRIKIDPESVDPKDLGLLEDLLVAACNDAKNKMEQKAAEEMAKLTQGLALPPGFKLPF